MSFYQLCSDTCINLALVQRIELNDSDESYTIVFEFGREEENYHVEEYGSSDEVRQEWFDLQTHIKTAGHGGCNGLRYGQEEE